MEYYALFVVVVILTGGLVLWFDPKNISFTKLLLSFSGAYLFGLIFLHIIPEIYHESHSEMGFYILLGFILQLALDYFSKGIEHGHAHHHGKRFPWAIFLGLCLHSFFEGMPVLQYDHGHIHTDSSLIWGIMIHKIPITIVLASLLKSSFNKKWSLALIFLFATTLPLGSLANYYIVKQSINPSHQSHIILAVVVGIMLHVSTTILYESDEGHKFNITKVLSILGGFLIAYLSI